MNIPISEAKSGDLMAEAKLLHDMIYNVEVFDALDTLRLEELYAEIERRGISVVEQSTVSFIESETGNN